jgi:hypothetical protein
VTEARYVQVVMINSDLNINNIIQRSFRIFPIGGRLSKTPSHAIHWVTLFSVKSMQCRLSNGLLELEGRCSRSRHRDVDEVVVWK